MHRPSHVLIALGRTEDEAIGTLRFSLGALSTESDVDKLLEVLPEVVYTETDISTGDEYYTVRYGNVVGLLVEAIKELKSEIEILKAK